ncbi:MAG: hypothetical protein M3313_09080 [Actinomycetota bacterium]|nr:hypothetical protein [Actinomycetota bacterium]
MTSSLELARTVADAVLYEGYLLYPYRATSSKNRVRWQFGVLGPPGAAAGGFGEEPDMQAQCLLRAGPQASVRLRLRFLQLQTREVQKASAPDSESFTPVEEFRLGGQTWMTWDETTEHEILLDPRAVAELQAGAVLPAEISGDEQTEQLRDGQGRVVARVVRRRWPLAAEVRLTTTPVDELTRLSVSVRNVAQDPVRDKDQAIRTSFIGAHLLISAEQAAFVSLLEPPDDARAAAAACHQHRCWPVLAGAPGDTDVVLASPIILYDYPEIADQSAGALFDSTEIDEILTLRVMTLTDQEKADARATDPRAAEIIDRCEHMSPETLQQLHGILRDPHAAVDAALAAEMTTFEAPPFGAPSERAGLAADMDMFDVPVFSTPRENSSPDADLRNVDPPVFHTGDAPWWDPAADASVAPDVDAVMIDGVSVAKDSLVRVHPSARADAQDMFFADQTARVTAVLSDVDGNVHVAVVLVDDPAADMHDWYGRYLYFAPEELEPLGQPSAGAAN